MKKNVVFIAFSTLLLLILPLAAAGCSYSETGSTMNQSAPDGYNVDDLNQYGEWVHVNPYGEAWRPYTVADWQPFTDGYWTYSGGDWTWISYEPFGWIVYHYGYWYNDPFYGWVWIPSDNQWSPARVNWVDYGDYIGWSPLPPPGVVYGPPWESREYKYWNVVRKQDFDREDVGNYRVGNPVRNDMGGRSEVRNEPPDRMRLESSTGDRIKDVRIPHRKVEIQKRELSRLDLPPAEKRKVDNHAEQVRRNKLISRDRYREQHNKRSE